MCTPSSTIRRTRTAPCSPSSRVKNVPASRRSDKIDAREVPRMAAARIALSVFVVAAMTTTAAQVRYPETRATDQADDYFGRKVADPYRWLEDDNSAETAAWVEAQNKVTFDYLAKIPAREPLKARLTTLWNFERYGVPSREGEFYIFARNDGLQNQ